MHQKPLDLLHALDDRLGVSVIEADDLRGQGLLRDGFLRPLRELRALGDAHDTAALDEIVVVRVQNLPQDDAPLDLLPVRVERRAFHLRLLHGGLLLGLADVVRRELALGDRLGRHVQVDWLHVVGRDRDVRLDGHVTDRAPQLHAALGLVRREEDRRAVRGQALLRKRAVLDVDLLRKAEEDELAVLREVVAHRREQQAQGLSPFDLVALAVAQLLVWHGQPLDAVRADRADLLAGLDEDVAHGLLQRLRRLGAGRHDHPLDCQGLDVRRVDRRRGRRVGRRRLLDKGVRRDRRRHGLCAQLRRRHNGGVVLVVFEAHHLDGLLFRGLRAQERRHERECAASADHL